MFLKVLDVRLFLILVYRYCYWSCDWLL